MAEPSIEGYAPEWLEYEQSLGGRTCLHGSAQEIIEQYTAMGAALAPLFPPPDTSVSTLDETADGVPVRIYTPPSANAAGNKLPLAIYMHGGGYLLGDLNGEDAWCRILAKDTPCIVVSVDYRLSTEHKMPAMLEDCITAYKWAYSNADKIGADSSRTIAIGSSAGGGLALTLTDQLLKSLPSLTPLGVIALVPVTAHPESLPSAYSPHYTAYKENASDVPILDWSTMSTFYTQAGINPFDEQTFITLSPRLDQFPPTYICYCGKDPLRDDGRVLEIMLKEKGRRVRAREWEGVPHYWWMFPGIKGGEQFWEEVVGGLRWVLEGGKD